jgi:glucose-1-phosphate adenylyltransferase
MKKPHVSHEDLLAFHKAATIILAGGQGTRLFPLTLSRCKPDVSFGGRYKLIDIPISNSINANISRIFIISQYFATSLNHHITTTFRAETLSGTAIQMLTPEETHEKKSWYMGTADAVRQNIQYFEQLPLDYLIILSGDQLYNMDLLDMLTFAKQKEADLTIATIPVSEKEATRMGIMKIDPNGYIIDFVEKPKNKEIFKNYQLKEPLDKSRPYLGSMGIYIFKKERLIELLRESNGDDFGKDIIPKQIASKGKTASYVYDGYWEDIGTVESFYTANLALTTHDLGLNLYNEVAPIYSQHVHLPSASMKKTIVHDSIICEGSVIKAKEIIHSLIGIRSRIGEDTVIHDSIIMGNTTYHAGIKESDPYEYLIGAHCHIKKAIIDEQTLIEDNVDLLNLENRTTFDSDHLYVRDGIIVVPSGAHIKKGFRF